MIGLPTQSPEEKRAAAEERRLNNESAARGRAEYDAAIIKARGENDRANADAAQQRRQKQREIDRENFRENVASARNQMLNVAFFITAGAAMVMAWGSMLLYGIYLYGIWTGWLMPLFSEGAGFAFSLKAERMLREDPGASVWRYRAGAIFFCLLGGAMNFADGLMDGPHPGLISAAVHAAVAMSVVIIHQLVYVSRLRNMRQRTNALVDRDAELHLRRGRRAIVRESRIRSDGRGNVTLAPPKGEFTLQGSHVIWHEPDDRYPDYGNGEAATALPVAGDAPAAKPAWSGEVKGFGGREITAVVDDDAAVMLASGATTRTRALTPGVNPNLARPANGSATATATPAAEVAHGADGATAPPLATVGATNGATRLCAADTNGHVASAPPRPAVPLRIQTPPGPDVHVLRPGAASIQEALAGANDSDVRTRTETANANVEHADSANGRPEGERPGDEHRGGDGGAFSGLAGELTRSLRQGDDGGTARIHSLLGGRTDYEDFVRWLGSRGKFGDKRLMALAALYATGDLASPGAVSNWIAGLVPGKPGHVEKADIRRIRDRIEPEWRAANHRAAAPSPGGGPDKEQESR